MNKTLLVCLCAVFSLAFLAFPAQASVELSTNSLNFGSVNVNFSSSAAKVTITNDSRDSVSIEYIWSSDSAFVVTGISLPVTLSPHSTTSFSVVFRPAAAQTYSGIVRVACDSRYRGGDTVTVTGTGVSAPAGGTQLLSPSTTNLPFGNGTVENTMSQSVSVTDAGKESVTVSTVAASGGGFTASGQNRKHGRQPDGQPQISVDPTSVSFGSLNTGQTSNQTLTISNPGTASLTISQASISGTGFTGSGLTPPLTIAAGSSSSFTVSFAPTTAGTFAGTLTIVNNSATPSVAVALSGTGTAQTLQLSASPTSVSFGSVATGSSMTKNVTLTNIGTGSVSLSNDTVTGTGFTVIGMSMPMTLNAGQSTSFNVSFAPTTSGSMNGSVTVSSNATNSPTTVSLGGTGVQPQISVTPASASFGNVTTGVTNTQTITISNPGTANLTVSQASMSGSGFAYSGLTTPLTVAPGGSSPFTVGFDPTTAGSFTGTLTLVSNSATPSAAVSLSGTGVAQTLQVSASPTSVSFGSVTTGTSATQTVTLTNTGNANVSLSNDSVAGTGFSITGLTLPLTLNAGQSTSFSVVFDPSSAGSASGSLSVTSNATNSPTTIALSGTGTSPPTFTVTLSWTPSSSSYSGFNAYRSTVSGGPYTKLDSSIIASPTYSDSTVTGGQTYYYVVTEVSTGGVESSYSSQTSVTIP